MRVYAGLLLILEGCFALWLLWQSESFHSLKGFLRCLLLIGLALVIRFSFFDQENTDYQWFLKVWVDHYRTHGGFAGLGQAIGNYNIPYLYFLALFSYSLIPDLYLIKLLSILFDIILAYSGMMLIRKCGGSILRSVFGFFLILYLPTVLLNSSYWGQCDSIYVAFAVLGLELALPDSSGKGRPILSMICIAVSFSFKLQAVFIMPVWLVLWVWRKYRWYHFGVFPLTYFILILPAVFAGRSLKDAVLLYADQAHTVGDALNYNSPSLTAFLHTSGSTGKLSLLLIVCAFLAMFLLLAAGIILRRRMTPRLFLCLTALMVLVIPFLLPHMHDRYFYAADVLTLILAVCIPYALPSAVLTQAGSLICYIAYFTGYYMRIGKTGIFLTNDKGAFAVLIAIVVTVFCSLLEQLSGDSWTKHVR